MTIRQLIGTATRLVVAFSIGSAVGMHGQEPAPTFKSSIDLVRVSVVVRDQNGKLVRNLNPHDFQLEDDGQPRPIADFHRDGADVSIALLFDISGSMENNMGVSRESGMHLLSWLGPNDEAAVYTFDTRLNEVAPFTSGLRTLPESMATVAPFGATSLHDAIARTAERVATREGRRRAVVVFSDGRDNASRLSPSEVSGIASSIDVPVYLFAAVPSIDNPDTEFSAGAERSALAGSLSELAAWTGGHVFVASTPAARSGAARQIVDELRHQYLIAFESSGTPGWHPLVVRALNKDLVVRARSGYIAGQSRPTSD